MKLFNILKFGIFFFCMCASCAYADEPKWIAPDDKNVDLPNRWAVFRKDFEVDSMPISKAKIAADSKYWLWINGKLAVFEGSLKRGPTPTGTYFDEVDIAPYLKKGKNTLSMLVWHFGKDGFSHKDSGKLGMIFCLEDENLKLVSDASWLSRIHPAYEMAGYPLPNYRLPESHVRFNALNDMPDWITCADPAKKYGFKKSVERGKWGDAPWNELVARPTPLWRDYGVKDVEHVRTERLKGYDRITAFLPYNMQMTPIITIDDPAGNTPIEILTDHTYSANEKNLRAEYVTKKGLQTYESLGWLNGQKIILNVPKGFNVKKIQYRQTGYDCDVVGSFACDDEFFNTFWKKAMRTLYVNMRDTYFDCPERERAQWWGDAVILMGQTFYFMSDKSHAIMLKGIKELVNWRKNDVVFHAPIPGMYMSELPGQMLASVGKYGFWNYYMNTGDVDTVRFVYPAVKDYLALWKFEDTGLPKLRKGEWTWGDWGKNKDITLIYAAFYSLALESASNMAKALGKADEAAEFDKLRQRVKEGFNCYWDGKAYRHSSHKELTDDRVQALAVLAGIADESKYPAILKFLNENRHASPYMEKYVMEAYFKMGAGADGVRRVKDRYARMINDKECTTLYEGWEIGGSGGGSVNHAWSGGPITVLSQYMMGLYPLEPGWKAFLVEPQPASFKKASIKTPTPQGMVSVSFEESDTTFELSVGVPEGAIAVVKLPMPGVSTTVSINGTTDISKYAPQKYPDESKPTFELPAGQYKIRALKK